MGVAVAHEATALGELVNGGLEDPEVPLGATQLQYRLRHNAPTMLPLGKAQQIAMRDEAFSIQG